MAKWNRAVRVPAEDILRNRGILKEGVVQEGIALDQSEDTPMPSYAFVEGWHFYAHLDIPASQEECDDAEDERSIAQVYHEYTQAAKRVVNVFGDRSELLEHQGALLHFHLQFGAKETNPMLAFGHLLATFVADNVMKHARKDLRFSMAAECGTCCILRVPSPLHEEASYSRVSLGPCANNPAKKLLGSEDVGAWKLAYRSSEDDNWHPVDCKADEDSRRLIRESKFGQPVINTKFSSAETPVQDGVDPIEDVPYHHAKRVPGYVFRADLDGFTRKVHDAFANGDEDTASSMAEAFISFMEEVSEWQLRPRDGVRFVTCPWAGDCCTMIIGFPDRNDEFDMGEAKKQISAYPIKLIGQWEAELAGHHKEDGLGAWTYSMALGHTRIFTEVVDDIPYRLTVGWPSSVSHEGVNASGTDKGDLIMHKEDVAQMTVAAQNGFRFLSAKFRRQDEDARQKTIKASVAALGQAARSTSYHSHPVIETRPYFPERKERL